MDTIDFFRTIQEDIHSVVIAVTDSNGLPVTCAVDIMDYDGDGLYFLTAKGKNLYGRLKDREYLSFTGIKGADTMHSVSVSVRGNVREIGTERLERLFEKNPYMNKIYPNEKSRQALTVFHIYRGAGEWFDLSKKPIERESFAFGGEGDIASCYFITDGCTDCGECFEVCPQKCIDINVHPARINRANCLHCGNCLKICPMGAVEKIGGAL